MRLDAIRRLKGPILVTGHTGFKGSWMTALLCELGIPVIGYSLPPEEQSLYNKLNHELKIKESLGDIRNYRKLSRFVQRNSPSAIIHMAAQPLVLKSYQEPRYTFDVNVMGTVNILEIARQTSSVKSSIVVTTDKVYKNFESGKKFIESDPMMGKDPYSASKVGSESVVSAWRQLNKFSGGAPIVAVRAGNVIGGGDLSENRLLPDIVKGKTNGKTITIRNPNSVRPWQHVLDPLCGYLLVLEKALSGNVSDSYNFGPREKSLSVFEVAQIACNRWDKDPSSLVIEEVDQEAEANLLELNSDLAVKELNWNPKWSQSQSIEKTIDWWKNLSSMTALEACRKDLVKYFKNE